VLGRPIDGATTNLWAVFSGGVTIGDGAEVCDFLGMVAYKYEGKYCGGLEKGEA
jgi:hypothetical protein